MQITRIYNFFFNYTLRLIVILVILLNINTQLFAQPDCSSYRSQPFTKIGNDHIYYTPLGYPNEVDISLGYKFFILEENKNLFYITWSGHYINIAKYDNNLVLIDSGSVFVEMLDKPYQKSNLRVFVLGESLYVSYLQKNPESTNDKLITMFVQKVNLSTFTLEDNKLTLFTENINTMQDVYPYVNIRQNLYLGISDNKEYLSILFFERDETAPAVLKYQILNSAFEVKFTGEMPVNEIIDRIAEVETHINNNGAFAVSLKLNKVNRLGENNDDTFRIFLVNSLNNSSIYDMEDALGYATNVKLFFTESILAIDCDWHYYTNEKPSGKVRKIKLLDVQTGKALPDFSQNVLVNLPEQEKINLMYGKSAKSLDELSEEFELEQVHSDLNNNAYFLFSYQIPDKFHTSNLKSDNLFVYYLVKFNGKMENQWAHLIYFPTAIFDKMVFRNNNITLIAKSFSSPGAGNAADSYDVFKATNDAGAKNKNKTYELQFNENGESVVKEFLKECGDYYNVFNFESSYFIQKYQTVILIQTGGEKRISRISY